MARLEFELAYYDSAVHRFNHYTTKTHTHKSCVPLLMFNNDEMSNFFILFFKIIRILLEIFFGILTNVCLHKKHIRH